MEPRIASLPRKREGSVCVAGLERTLVEALIEAVT